MNALIHDLPFSSDRDLRKDISEAPKGSKVGKRPLQNAQKPLAKPMIRGLEHPMMNLLIKPVVFRDFVTPIAPNCAKRRHPYSTS